MWFNNFAEFERKQTRENRLVLNFYSPDTGKSVKAYVNQNVRIPTRFLTYEGLNHIRREIAKNPELAGYTLSAREAGRFYVANIKMPHNLQQIHQLPKAFQTGNYDKLLRFSGFYPERKAALSPDLEKRFASSDEIELENLDGVEFKNEFLTEEEFYRLPSLYIDIEKPLWKKDDERPLLEEREQLVKLEERYLRLNSKQEQGKKLDEKQAKALNLLSGEHKQRASRISELEENLTIDVRGVGKVRLYDERFNADISFVTTIWTDPSKGTEIRELYVLDPLDEIRKKTHKGYKILKFKIEEELVQALTDNLHKRKPAISRGHNQVYDVSQLTYAAEEHGMIFDPAVKHVKPRRDVVRKFLQRLREDMIYLDTLWIHRFMASYLQQKSFGSNLKLASIAKHRGFDFKKSLTHEQLRYEEIKRLAGKTKETRRKANLKMLEYATDDVDYTKGISDILDPIYIPLLVRIKEVLPFATYSEIAFSTNCMKKWHEFRHFQRCGKIQHYGYRAKIRENERQIFKKRFPAFKKLRMEETAGFKPIRGVHKRIVREYYFSLEESLIDWAFSIEPKLKPIYDWASEQSAKSKEGREQFFGFMQYIRDFMKEPFTDYYFARRDGRAFFHARDFLFKNHARKTNQELTPELKSGLESKLLEKLNALEIALKPKPNDKYNLLNQFLGSFKFLKNHFRSIYVDLEGQERGVIRPSDKKIGQLYSNELFPEFADNVSLPEIAGRFDADLYLLRKHYKAIQNNLTPAQTTTLKSFLTNFQKFDETSKAVQDIMQQKEITANGSSLFDLLYAYLYWKRYTEDDRSFEPAYKTRVKDVNVRIEKAYKDLAARISEKGKVIGYKGDYIFVALKPGHHLSIPWLHPVRRLRKHTIGEVSELDAKHPRLAL